MYLSHRLQLWGATEACDNLDAHMCGEMACPTSLNALQQGNKDAAQQPKAHETTESNHGSDFRNSINAQP